MLLKDFSLIGWIKSTVASFPRIVILLDVEGARFSSGCAPHVGRFGCTADEVPHSYDLAHPCSSCIYHEDMLGSSSAGLRDVQSLHVVGREPGPRIYACDVQHAHRGGSTTRCFVAVTIVGAIL